MRGAGGLDAGLRAQLTVGEPKRRLDEHGGVRTMVSLGLAYDVAIDDRDAQALLLAVSSQLQAPTNV